MKSSLPGLRLIWVLVLAVFAAAPGREGGIEIPSFQGKIRGMSLNAERLGVVLDVSQSMKEALPGIRAELKEKLPRNPVLHVDGGKLVKPEPRAQVEKGFAPEPVTAVIALAEQADVDAVLWISDMADPPNRNGVEAMEAVLSNHGIQFYILSVERKPGPAIRRLAEETDGWWKLTGKLE